MHNEPQLPRLAFFFFFKKRSTVGHKEGMSFEKHTDFLPLRTHAAPRTQRGRAQALLGPKGRRADTEADGARLLGKCCRGTAGGEGQPAARSRCPSRASLLRPGRKARAAPAAVGGRAEVQAMICLSQRRGLQASRLSTGRPRGSLHAHPSPWFTCHVATTSCGTPDASVAPSTEVCPEVEAPNSGGPRPAARGTGVKGWTGR